MTLFALANPEQCQRCGANGMRQIADSSTGEPSVATDAPSMLHSLRYEYNQTRFSNDAVQRDFDWLMESIDQRLAAEAEMDKYDDSAK